MPSPMGLPIPVQPSHFSQKKRSTSSLTDARSLLAYVSEGDRERRERQLEQIQKHEEKLSSAASFSTASTPALSSSSSLTTESSDDSTLQECYDADLYDNLDDPNDDDETGLLRSPHPPNSTQVFTTRHIEFGHCANQAYRHTSQHPKGKEFVPPNEGLEPPHHVYLFTYLSYLLLIVVGHMRDFFGKRFAKKNYAHLMPHDGYAALNSDFDSFYTRRLKARMDDTFSRPVTGVPGRTIVLLDRHSKDRNASFYPTGTRTRALNVSSYNYLGFAQARGGCADAVVEGIKRYGVSACAARLEGGTTDLHVQAEALVAQFLGQEDALITSMGYATNSTTLPALVGKGCLVISDELNHASIRFGVRLSGAVVRTFKHNDMKNLEALLRDVISQGQPRTHRPWKKIMLVVEGLYSMEGTLVNLPGIMELKKKYKFYLYVDEAHSVGAMGPHGRGVVDYFGVNPRDIEILMGTFTKSFGASGGYISGSRALINRLRLRTHAGPYAESIAPPVLTQIIASMSSIMGVVQSTPAQPATAIEFPGPAPSSALPTWLNLPPALRDGFEGRERLRRLAFNARYLSRALTRLGFFTYGHSDSPIVPLLLFNPGKMCLFSRMMLERKTPIVVVVVGYPATPLVESRVRFCLSASHTKEDIDTLLRACDEVGDLLHLKQGNFYPRWTIDEVISRAVELVEMED